jgi:hypothetical protein
MSAEQAAFLASVLDGTVKPRRVRGGPSSELLWHKFKMDLLYTRPMFERVLRVKQWQQNRRPELKLNAREESYEYVAKWLSKMGMPLTPSAVKKRIESKRKKIDGDAAEFREVWKSGTEKKPPEEK